MLAFEEARTQLVGLAPAAVVENVRLEAARGRVLAADVLAPEAQPNHDNSAMDGYALNTRDLPSESPFSLPVFGESRAGCALPELRPQHACRIFTGAHVPAGADAVLLQENAERVGEVVVFSHRPRPFEHIRRRGEDLVAGAVALSAGTRIGPFHLGLCAALELTQLTVSKKPRVAILCTGDELRRPGAPVTPDSLPESNSIALQALLEQAGADVWITPVVPDRLVATEDAIRQALAHADLVLTVGGVSVGVHDYVKAAIANLGATLDFWKVKIKPGKPLAVAKLGNQLIIGLPGNPVSAQVTCILFVLPLIRKMQGQTRLFAPFRPATLLTPLRQKPGRTGFFRAQWSEQGVTPLQRDSSGSVTSMSDADALVMADADIAEFAAGSVMPTLSLYDAVYL
jgi:molybdopterin molybdotransferase